MTRDASAGWRAEYRHQGVQPDAIEAEPVGNRTSPTPAARTPAVSLSAFSQS